MSDIAAEKNRLRAEIRERLKKLQPEEIAAQSADVCRRAMELAEFNSAGLILGYMAMPRECDPQALMDMARKMGKDVAFPKCMPGSRLELYAAERFVPGAYGIMEPDISTSRRVDIRDVELIIAPGVAFDSRCARLGHGAGYYDRLLEEAAATVIGFALEQQMVDRVPSQQHDRRMDMVLWRNGIYCK